MRKALILLVCVIVAGCTVTPTHESERIMQEQMVQFKMIQAMYDKESNIWAEQIISLRQSIEMADRVIDQKNREIEGLKDEITRLTVEKNQCEVDRQDLRDKFVITPRKRKIKHEQSTN